MHFKHFNVIICCLLLTISSLLNANQPSINITYDQPRLSFDCFMDTLMKKVTWPSTVAGFKALTQIGLAGCCTYFGLCLLKTGINALAQSFTPAGASNGVEAPSKGQAHTNKKGILTYFIGGTTLTAAGIWWLVYKKMHLNPDEPVAS